MEGSTPNKRVVGLKYEPESGPPSVVLKGVGKTADTVLETRKSLTKPPVLVENEKLLDQLYRLPVDATIDPALYELVAILLVHVFSVDQMYEENQ